MKKTVLGIGLGSHIIIVEEQIVDSVFFIDQGDLVNLVAHTRHGNNRLNQHGNPWVIKELRNGRMLLESNGPTDRGEFDWRWVDLHDDKDFTWRKA